MLHKPGSGKRGRRRTALARKKREALKIYPHDPKARSANHLALCSCYMCGNPRRYSGEQTMQERRAEARAVGTLEEIS